jgi:hypothetical protein
MESFIQAMGEGEEDPESAGRIQEIIQLMEPKVREHLPRINDARAQVYARNFSAEELGQLIAFVQSSAGKRYLSGMYDIESDPLIEAASQELMDSLQDISKEQCQKRAAQRYAAGDTEAKCPLSGQSGAKAG